MSWSECFQTLAKACSARAGLEDVQIAAAQAQAACLNRSGQRAEAVHVLESVIEVHPDRLYSLGPRVDLGTYLRAQHEFERALQELSRAQELSASLKAGGDHSAYLRNPEAIGMSELGAVRAALGMTTDARANFEGADGLAQGLDEFDGPIVWGGNLVYRLNLATSRQKGGEVRRIREQYESHPWRTKLPEETRKQIEMRLAISASMEAFRGSKLAGAGEAELRALIDSGLKLEEGLRARTFLGQSLLDRGALAEAREVLDQASERLGAEEGLELPRLHLLGLHALLQRKEGASREERLRVLTEQLGPAIERFLERAHRRPIERAGISLLLYEWSRAALSELVELELGLDRTGRGAQQAFEWILKLQAAGSFAREQNLELPTLETVRGALLGQGAGLLLYVPGRVQSHVFALTATEIRVHRLQPDWQMDLRARELEEALQSSIMARSAASDQRLARQLEASSLSFVPPALNRELANWTAIQVVGLEDFGYVPLEALAGPTGEPLGRTHPVTYQPSIPMGVWLAGKAKELGGGLGPALYFLGQGDPSQGGRPRLAALQLDASDLGVDALRQRSLPYELFGSDDLARLPERMASASMAVFLLHGLYDPNRARPAGLLMRPELDAGVWFSDTIEAIECPPFSLLAACGGDRAQERRGDDGQGHLRSAFFRSGSVAVATSTLALESRATQQFVSLVSKGLANGNSISEAFHQARESANPERFSTHPVHAFLLHVYGAGEWRPFSSSGSPSQSESSVAAQNKREQAWFPWLILLTLLVAGAILAVLRMRSRSPSSADR